jgi:hypothetical protein
MERRLCNWKMWFLQLWSMMLLCFPTRFPTEFCQSLDYLRARSSSVAPSPSTYDKLNTAANLIWRENWADLEILHSCRCTCTCSVYVRVYPFPPKTKRQVICTVRILHATKLASSHAQSVSQARARKTKTVWNDKGRTEHVASSSYLATRAGCIKPCRQSRGSSKLVPHELSSDADASSHLLVVRSPVNRKHWSQIRGVQFFFHLSFFSRSTRKFTGENVSQRNYLRWKMYSFFILFLFSSRSGFSKFKTLSSLT